MMVLIPFNGSDTAWKAVNYALEKAKKNTLVRVTIIAVVTKEQCFMSANFINNPVGLLDDYYNYLSHQTQKVKALFAREGIPLNVIIEKGNIVQCILKAVDTFYVDQIIMGRNRLSLVKDILFGNVVYKVLEDVKVPVTLVR